MSSTITLAIDASTYVGDVAALDGSRVLTEESTAMKDAVHERLMPAVASVLERAGVAVRDVGRVVCGEGPGSFTSLRIAGGIAKGLAMGAGLPLFAVPSLALIVAGADVEPGEYLAVLDALRGESYVGTYRVTNDGTVNEVEPARLVPTGDIVSVAEGRQILSPLRLPDAIEAHPRARGVAKLEGLLAARGPVDLGVWEPSYGRLAEAQVKWETTHGRPLPTA